VAEKKPSRGFQPPVWGIFLVFTGTIFLLQTLNVLPWSLWGNLWRFWPVLIIIAGLTVLLGARKAGLIIILVVVILVASLGIAIRQSRIQEPLLGTSTYTEAQAGLRNTQVEMSFQAGKAMLAELGPGSPNLVEVTYQGNSLTRNYWRDNGTGILTLNGTAEPFFPRNRMVDWMIKLAPDIPMTIEVDTSASDLILDMSRLNVTQFNLEANAAQCEITMPASGKTEAEITANVASITITIPSNVAARIEKKTSLSTLYVDQNRFPLRDGYYTSLAYNMSAHQLDLKVDCNVGMVRIR